jgi:uncharacterized membrane protein YbhN (UPF0104 family)
MTNLTRISILGIARLIIGLGILLFVPAWTADFWQAWVYLFVFVGSAALITAYLWKNDPKLLERRVKAGPRAEKEKSQKVIQLFATLLFFGDVAANLVAAGVKFPSRTGPASASV